MNYTVVFYHGGEEQDFDVVGEQVENLATTVVETIGEMTDNPDTPFTCKDSMGNVIFTEENVL
jgi:hypothetical protein